jgi:hypothetical protein
MQITVKTTPVAVVDSRRIRFGASIIQPAAVKDVGRIRVGASIPRNPRG